MADCKVTSRVSDKKNEKPAAEGVGRHGLDRAKPASRRCSRSGGRAAGLQPLGGGVNQGARAQPHHAAGEVDAGGAPIGRGRLGCPLALLLLPPLLPPAQSGTLQSHG